MEELNQKTWRRKKTGTNNIHRREDNVPLSHCYIINSQSWLYLGRLTSSLLTDRVSRKSRKQAEVTYVLVSYHCDAMAPHVSAFWSKVFVTHSHALCKDLLEDIYAVTLVWGTKSAVSLSIVEIKWLKLGLKL